MKSLLTLTALFEAATGLALLIMPATAVSLLLGPSLTEPSGILLGRIGGAALISLAIACWLSKDDSTSSIVLIKTLLVYNILAALLLGYAGLLEHFSGIGLWPALLLHTALAIWCQQTLRRKR
jgi:hypothetical protein